MKKSDSQARASSISTVMPSQLINNLQRYRQNLRRSSALQQGLLSISIFLLSLFLLSIVTYFFVQNGLATRLDDSLQQRMLALQQQVAEESDDDDEYEADDYEELPHQSGNNVLGRPVFYRVLPIAELDKKQNRLFRKTGYTTRMFRQKAKNDDDDMLVYRMLVRHDNGLVLVVGENNDEDHEIIEIVMSAFVLNGLVALILTALLVMYLGNRSHRQIRRIEHVLQHAAQGDLKQRIGPSPSKNNDLAHVSRQIDTMLSRLETSMAAMTDISANIAHELKTPVSRLRHDLITALEQHEAGENPEGSLQNAYDESGTIAETFDALLRIAQIEGGARRAHFTVIELDNVINVVQDIYTEVAEDAEMELSKRITLASDNQPLRLRGDKELLVQMLANLVENAIRYCAAGTKIAISAREVVDNANNRTIELSVADSGVGIPAEECELVFQRLYRLDKSRSDGQGTGLGLSLVKAIVELHDAKIKLQDNTPGLRVMMWFPLLD